MSQESSSAGQTILATGCSSGLGRTVSEVLARQGHTVFATMREMEGKNALAAAALSQLAQAAGLALHVLELDVTDDGSPGQAVQTAVQETGRLDVVINNAGTMAIGISETLTVDQMRHLCNTHYGDHGDFY